MEYTTTSLDDSHLAPIGDVTTAWALLEQILDSAVWVFSGVPNVDIGACLTSQIPTTIRKIYAVIALTTHHGASKDLLASLNKFSETRSRLQSRRNRIVHDSWLVGGESKTLYRLGITAERKLVFEHRPFDTAQHLHSVADEIRGQVSILVNLFHKTLSEPPIETFIRNSSSGEQR